MEAYESWFQREGEHGLRQLAVLRLLGLFDRPAPGSCLDGLRAEPAIAGLTEPLAALPARDWRVVTSRLEEIGLLTVQADGSLDAHPLLREYFARRVCEEQPEGWRAAHRRLYEHLCETTNEGDEPTLEDLQPLYQAVAHGCQAGLQQQALEDVYGARISRGHAYYSTYKLGAFGSNLGAVACFFEQPRSGVSPALSDAAQAWVLNQAAFGLRALVRLGEARAPFRVGLTMRVEQEDWRNAAAIASNLSELELAPGRDRRGGGGCRAGCGLRRPKRRSVHADGHAHN
jgi:hypothetical protein